MKHTLLTTFLILALIGINYANTADLPILPIVDTQVRAERADIDALILITAQELRGQTSGSSMVTFAPNARIALQSDGFDYAGFGRPRYLLTRLVESEMNFNQIEVGAIMIFTDALLRRTSVSVLLTCTWSDDGQHIAVNAATINRLTPPQLQMVFSIVPADRVPQNLLMNSSHIELLLWIIANRATDTELTSGEFNDYFLFAMVYDRLAPGAGIKILIADDPDGTSGQAGNSQDLNYSGWHVAMLRGIFNWKADETFYAKVIYTVPANSSEPQVIGILSSQLIPVGGDGRPIISSSIVDGMTNRDDPGVENERNNITISDYNSILKPDRVKGNLTQSNKLPVVNFEIGTVSGGSFEAPVWIKFYPVGTYDPDGHIVLFEMDMDGDGIYDVKEKTLTGSSYEFTIPGEYIASVKVTDDKGGITVKSKSFIINEVDNAFTKSVDNQITVIPSDAWEETSIPWIKVWAPNGTSIVTKEVDSNSIPEGNFKSISPIISIEPQDENSILGAIRVKMPDSIHVAEKDKGRVVLAFYEEGYSISTGEVESRWRFHSVDYDSKTDTYEAQMNHGCFVTWGLVTLGAVVGYLVWDDATRLLMSKRESDHFVLHYNQKEISEKTATFTLNKLEEAQTFLTKDISKGGLGLDYPSIPAKLDIYFISLKSKKSVNYGLYCQGKTGARWMDLNLPSNISNYDRLVLRATLAHELFHYIQFPYEGYSTFKDAWIRKGKQLVVSGNNFPYGWLNEALSSAVELTAVKTYNPNRESPILDNDLLKKGLKGLVTPEDGYSAGLFINFLVHRYSVAIYSTILDECKRQVKAGTKQDPVVAIQRAISRLGRIQFPLKHTWWELDAVWQAFTDAFIKEKSDPQLIDERLDRTIPYTNKSSMKLTVGETEVVKEWSIEVPALSLKPLASRTYNISPAIWNDEDKTIIDCNVTFTPQEKTPFNITTLIAFSNKKGKKALLPVQSRILGRINNKALDLTFTLNLEKKNRFNLLSFIPTGLGAKKNQGVANGTYKLTCKLRKEENIEVSPAVPISTSAIDNYWWAYWKTAIEIKNSDKNTWDILNESPLGNLYRKAWSEWEPIENQIITINKRFDTIRNNVELYSRMNTAYSNETQEVHPLLMEISNNYIDVWNVYANVSGAFEVFSNIQTIGMKSEVIVSPNRLRYLHIRKSTALPLQMEIQKALNGFHKHLAMITPCKQALSSFEEYWEKNKNEALKIIEEIKILYPSLKK